MGDRAYAEVVCREEVGAFEDLGLGEEQEHWKELPAGLVDKKQLQAVKRSWRAVVRGRQKLGS